VRANDLSRLLAGAGASVYLILLLCFTFALLNSMIILAAPLYALRMQASATMLGALVASYVASGLFLSLPGAALCYRLGLRSVVILSFCLFLTANFVDLVAVSPSWLILGQLLAGVADLLFTLGGLAYLTEVAPHSRQNLAHSAAFTGMGVGWVCGSALGGLVAQWVGFDGVFLLGTLVSVVAVGVSLCLPAVNSQPHQATVSTRGILASYQVGYDLLRANKAVRRVALANCLATLGWYTFGSSFYLDYLHQLAVPVGTIGLLRALGSAAKVLAPFLYLLISERVGPLLIIFFGLLFGGLGLAMTPILTSVLTLAIVGTLAQAADAFRLRGVFGLLYIGTRSGERPTSLAVMNTFWALAAFVGGPFWGLTARPIGLSNTFLVAGLTIMLGAFGLIIRSRRL
jgi:predicted MFS family arabinose efflux permease